MASPIPPRPRSTTPLLIECDRPPPGWRCTRGVHADGPCAAVRRLCEIVEASGKPPTGRAPKCVMPWGHGGMVHGNGYISWRSPATEPLHHTRQRQLVAELAATPCAVEEAAPPASSCQLPSLRAPGGRLFGTELPPPVLTAEERALAFPTRLPPPLPARESPARVAGDYQGLWRLAEARVAVERRHARLLATIVVVQVAVIAGLLSAGAHLLLRTR